MKILLIIPILFSILFFSGCKSLTDMLKEKVTVEQSLNRKHSIDNSINPAEKYVLLKNLQQKRIVIQSVTVKKVTTSANIDYEFCVIADITASSGTVECYIYSYDIITIAKLSENSSKIQVEGDFSRFFTLLDSSFAKLEITDAKITIL